MIFKISAGEPHHAKGIAQVHVGSWRTTYKGIVADATLANMNIEVRIKQWANRLADKEPRTCTFVAMDPNEQVIGFANGGPVRSEELKADGELYAIYLYEESQRKGIGGALLWETACYLNGAGFTSLGVWVLERNLSRLFYEALGAEQIAEKTLTRDGLMLKEIGYRWQSIRSLMQRIDH
jgi:GNAT superfamily N-acetyltransferase